MYPKAIISRCFLAGLIMIIFVSLDAGNDQMRYCLRHLPKVMVHQGPVL